MYPIALEVQSQVGVDIDEAREQGDISEVDDFRTRRDRVWLNPGDPAALDENNRRRENAAGGDVEQARGPDDDGRGRRGRGLARERYGQAETSQ
jgi:hypothetical protein